MEDSRVVAQRPAADDCLDLDEIARKIFQRRPTYRWRLRIDVQRRVLQSRIQQVSVKFRVILEILFLLALANLVKRRLSDIDVAALYQLGHLPVEKRQQERSDMRAVDIGVSHDNDAVITQLVRIE